MSTLTFEITRFFGRLKRSIRKRLHRATPEKTRSSSRLLASVTCAKRLLERADYEGSEQIWRALESEYGNLFSASSISRLYQSAIAQLRNIEDYRRALAEYWAERRSLRDDGLRVVIYTAIADDYDSIKLPYKFDPKYRYVLFCDRPKDFTGAYELRDMSYVDSDPVRTARYVKTHPHLLLDGCDIAIWIDSNIVIMDSIEPLVRKFLESKLLIGAAPHSERRSVEEELGVCVKWKKDDWQILPHYADVLRRRNFETCELAATNFIMFDLRDSKTSAFLDTWWSEINNFSRRDQLSFNFALASHDLHYHPLFSCPVSVQSHPSFCQVPHDHGDGPSKHVLAALSPVGQALQQRRSYADVRETRIAAMKTNSIDVVVCVHNALEDVRQCLNSVAAHRSGDHLRLILVDDGSDHPTRNFLEEFAAASGWVTVLRTEKATGYTRAANRGLAFSSAPFVILLNSDTMVTDGWAEKMAHAVIATKGAGIVGPMSNAAGPQSIPNIKGTSAQSAINELPPGHSPDSLNRLCEEWTDESLLPRVPVVHGFCLGVTRNTINTVGRFDENRYPNGYGEENDFCFRAADAGISLVIATHTFVFHAKSKSYSNGIRQRLVRDATEALTTSFGEARLKRTVLTMRNNPHLQVIRTRAGALFIDKERF